MSNKKLSAKAGQLQFYIELRTYLATKIGDFPSDQNVHVNYPIAYQRFTIVVDDPHPAEKAALWLTILASFEVLAAALAQGFLKLRNHFQAP
jgi:hypothetical protein